jgi:hypothetical protein
MQPPSICAASNVRCRAAIGDALEDNPRQAKRLKSILDLARKETPDGIRNPEAALVGQMRHDFRPLRITEPKQAFFHIKGR